MRVETISYRVIAGDESQHVYVQEVFKSLEDSAAPTPSNNPVTRTPRKDVIVLVKISFQQW
jgi:hypothetical protein